MASIWTTSGFVAFVLLVICTCTYIQEIGFGPVRRVLLGSRHGGLGTFYKAAVVGRRLGPLVAGLALGAGLLVLLL